jgi:flagellar export protein FliJ
MPYRSQLSAVLLLRTLHEEEAFREWGLAKDSLASEKQRLCRLHERLQSTLDDLAEKQEHLVSADEITIYFRFIDNLREGITGQQKIVDHQEAICEGKRGLLEMAVKEKKSVEQIEEKRRSGYFMARFKKEQTELDELGGQLKLRRGNE